MKPVSLRFSVDALLHHLVARPRRCSSPAIMYDGLKQAGGCFIAISRVNTFQL